jgi:hypothetical protein
MVRRRRNTLSNLSALFEKFEVNSRQKLVRRLMAMLRGGLL